MPLRAIGWSLTTAAGLLGAVGLVAQLPTLGVPVPLGEVIVGLLLMVSTYLFTASIRHGTDVVRLQAQQLYNADNIAVLQGEAASIDRRIADSRHASRNELATMLGEMELRIEVRLKELRESQSELQRLILERRAQHRQNDAPGG